MNQEVENGEKQWQVFALQELTYTKHYYDDGIFCVKALKSMRRALKTLCKVLTYILKLF